MRDYVDGVVITAGGEECCATVHDAWSAASAFSADMGLVLHTQKSARFASTARGRAALRFGVPVRRQEDSCPVYDAASEACDVFGAHVRVCLCERGGRALLAVAMALSGAVIGPELEQARLLDGAGRCFEDM